MAPYVISTDLKPHTSLPDQTAEMSLAVEATPSKLDEIVDALLRNGRKIWHVIRIPVILVSLLGGHVLLVVAYCLTGRVFGFLLGMWILHVLPEEYRTIAEFLALALTITFFAGLGYVIYAPCRYISFPVFRSIILKYAPSRDLKSEGLEDLLSEEEGQDSPDRVGVGLSPMEKERMIKAIPVALTGLTFLGLIALASPH